MLRHFPDAGIKQVWHKPDGVPREWKTDFVDLWNVFSVTKTKRNHILQQQTGIWASTLILSSSTQTVIHLSLKHIRQIIVMLYLLSYYLNIWDRILSINTLCFVSFTTKLQRSGDEISLINHVSCPQTTFSSSTVKEVLSLSSLCHFWHLQCFCRFVCSGLLEDSSGATHEGLSVSKQQPDTHHKAISNTARLCWEYTEVYVKQGLVNHKSSL